MIKVLTISIIVYACSLAVMATLATISEAWKDDRKTAVKVVFIPLLNTLVILVGIFYLIPQQIIEQRNEKIKQQHKHDPRWNLMNNRE
jgi:p-aminobenzoyl-glutamate transporter AbgT